MAEEVAWLDTMNEESELTRMKANEAASIIQVSKSSNSAVILYYVISTIILYTYIYIHI